MTKRKSGKHELEATSPKVQMANTIEFTIDKVIDMCYDTTKFDVEYLDKRLALMFDATASDDIEDKAARLIIHQFRQLIKIVNAQS